MKGLTPDGVKPSKTKCDKLAAKQQINSGIEINTNGKDVIKQNHTVCVYVLCSIKCGNYRNIFSKLAMWIIYVRK